MAREGVQGLTVPPRKAHEYDDRQTEAAKRVLMDLGQILAAFSDSLVVVGGWVPDLLIEGAEERHVGSIDILARYVDDYLFCRHIVDGHRSERL